ncbi:hypothetical protein YTPLAS18_36650 [Nitrospira sp.]|nr:hypothetical protein YTPLAS18_36650 [Nitrospira sp.]
MGKTKVWIRGGIGCVFVCLVTTAPTVAQRQDMMRPRVPADKLAEARALTNPLPDSDEVIEKGKTLYEGKGGCVKCHGMTGKGDGEASAGLNPPPRNFHHHGFWRHRSDGEIFWVVKNGSPGTAMIPFAGTLSDEEIWSIIGYERTFAGGRGRGGGMGSEGMGRHGGMRGAESGSECMGRGCRDESEDGLTRP